MSQPFIETKEVCKSFAGVRALSDVSFRLFPGEIRCLAGENGSGKSTLIKLLASVHHPDSGEILIDGAAVHGLQPIDSIRAGIQVIYQDLSLFPNLTVAENLALNSHLEQNRFFMNWRATRRIAEHALDQLGARVDLLKTVDEISFAEKQLVAIARALLQDARLIIMDEPTTALTQHEVDALFQIVRKLKSKGISILFISHKLTEILEISDTISILRDGELVAEGPAVDFDYKKLERHMTGREIEGPRYLSAETHDSEHKLLQVRNLSRKGCFENIDFSVRPGEILGITGLLGSGRTALALSLFGLAPTESGEILIDGRPVRIDTPQDAIRNGVAYVPEDRLTEGLFLEQSIERNASISGLPTWTGRLGRLDFSEMRGVVRRWISDLNIKISSLALPVCTLSGGNQQKVVLAKWLATEAGILILNSPTVGIDIGAKEEIHRKIQELARDGIGVIVISDDLSELCLNCNRILLIHRGRLIEEFDTERCDEQSLGGRLSELR